MTHYLQDELTAFWSRLVPYFVILESNQQDGTGPIGRVTIDTDDHQAFALHTTDVKPAGDTSENPTGQSATYTRFKVAGAEWGPWQRETWQ